MTKNYYSVISGLSLFIFFFLFFTVTYSQNDVDSLNQNEEEEQAKNLVRFLTFTLNTLGDPDVHMKEKDIIINQSYLKFFRDENVQIEDDLLDNRDVVTNKNVQAYLKDINFFFKEVKFEFTIEELSRELTEEGQIYYIISMNRRMSGISFEGDSVNNIIPRFVEINVDEENKDLKIVSLYTTKLSEKKEMEQWWMQLSPAWKEYFAKYILAEDSIFIKNIISFGDSSIAISLDDSTNLTSENNPDQNDSISWTEFNQVYIQVDDSTTIQLFDTVPFNTGNFYKRIKQFWTLERIDISGNTAINNLDPLKKINGLKSLDISHTNIDDLSAIRNLIKMERLICSHTHIDSLGVLKYTSKLKILDIDNTYLTNLLDIKYFPQLNTLHFNNTPISSIAPLSELKSLKELRCSNTWVDYLAPLEDLVQLELLDLSKTKINNLEPLKQLFDLKYLNIDNTNISDISPLSSNKNLKFLYCDYSEVKSLEPLNGMERLERVYCDETQIGSEEANTFMRDNPQILIIYDSEELISWWEELEEKWKSVFSDIIHIDSFPSREILHQITQIQKIDISNHDDITNIEPLRELLNLFELDFANTNISSIEPISELLHLQSLNASSSQISDLEALRKLIALKRINLSNTTISDLEPISKLINLKYLNFKACNVSDITPLAYIESLEIIYADNTNLNFDNVDSFYNDNKNCQVIFQTAQLEQWWNDLSKAWKDVFLKYDYMKEPPSKEALHKLARIEELYINGNSDIMSLSALIMLKNLKTMDCSNTGLKDVSPLVDLLYLNKLICSDNPLTSLSSVQKMKKLEELNISNTLVTDFIPLENLQNLKNLNISGTEAKNLKFIYSLEKLEVLDISNTRIKDVKPLENLSRLKSIICFRTNLNQKKIDRLKSALPDVDINFY